MPSSRASCCATMGSAGSRVSQRGEIMGGMLRVLRGGGNAKGFARRRCGRLGSAAHGQSKATSEKEDSEA
jgi:hypothetical protein